MASRGIWHPPSGIHQPEEYMGFHVHVFRRSLWIQGWVVYGLLILSHGQMVATLRDRQTRGERACVGPLSLP